MKINVHSLAFKQSVTVLVSISIVFALLFGIGGFQINEKLSQMLLQKGEEISRANVALINNLFSSGKSFGEELAVKVGAQNLSGKELDDFLLRSLSGVRATVPQVVTVVAAFEPGKAPGKVEGDYMRLAYYSKGESSIIEGGDYQEAPWYKSTKDSLKGRWQDPFAGQFIKEQIVIYTAPIFRTGEAEQKDFVGVLCVGISIANLKDAIASIPISSSGYAVVLSADNTIIAHPKNELTFKSNFASISRSASHKRLVEFENAVDQMKHGLFLGSSVDGEDAAIYFTAMESINWKFLIVWPAKTFMEEQRSVGHMFAFISLCGYIILFIIVLLMIRRISLPLRAIAAAADKIGHGEFSAEIPVVSGDDEISQLATAFEDMRHSLCNYFETEKSLDRVKRDLDFSRGLQLGLLPKDESEENTADNRHALAPLLLPAEDIGGDFYDFFKLDDDRLAIVIADVSGKGVPATLLMMVSRIVIRTLAAHLNSVSDIFNETNYELARRNKDNLFVSMWMGILNLKTGHVDYVSAGHRPPIIHHKDCSVEFIKCKPNLAMAVMEETKYTQESLTLAPGDTLFLYTDGIIEAENMDGEPFGKFELLKVLSECCENEPTEICKFVNEHLDRYVGHARQMDDIAMLAVRYDGDRSNNG